MTSPGEDEINTKTQNEAVLYLKNEFRCNYRIKLNKVFERVRSTFETIDLESKLISAMKKGYGEVELFNDPMIDNFSNKQVLDIEDIVRKILKKRGLEGYFLPVFLPHQIAIIINTKDTKRLVHGFIQERIINLEEKVKKLEEQERIINLEEKVKKLEEQVKTLNLLPDHPEYYNVKEHFENEAVNFVF